MNILIGGRLGRYADRVLAFRRAGHKIVYCNMPAPTQKPLADDLKDASIPRYFARRGEAGKLVARIVAEHEIDVIYVLKNAWDGSLELVEEILDAKVDVPIVRHYKEHFCEPNGLERRNLLETAAQIFINEESREYFRRLYDVRPESSYILDTDYLPERYLAGQLQPKLSGTLGGRPHLLMAGGLSSNNRRNDVRALCHEMTALGVRVHLFGRKFLGPDQHGVWGVDHEPSRREYESLADEGKCELHDHVEPENFLGAWSGYDLGLMHPACSQAADAFAPFNYPNRLSPYLACGLPVAQERGSHTALIRLIETKGVGFVFRDYDHLAEILHDRAEVARVTDIVLQRRREFTYEYHLPRLTEILSRHRRP